MRATVATANAMDALVLADLFDDERGLHGQLSDGHEHQRLNLIQARVNFLDQRDAVRRRLTRSILRLGDDVLTVKNLGDGLLLDGGGQLESHLENTLCTTTNNLVNKSLPSWALVLTN